MLRRRSCIIGRGGLLRDVTTTIAAGDSREKKGVMMQDVFGHDQHASFRRTSKYLS